MEASKDKRVIVKNGILNTTVEGSVIVCKFIV